MSKEKDVQSVYDAYGISDADFDDNPLENQLVTVLQAKMPSLYEQADNVYDVNANSLTGLVK